MHFSKEKTQVAIAVILIVLITVIIPNNAKDWLVAESGKLEFLPLIGPLLAMGLIFKWRNTREIASVAFAVTAFVLASILIMNPSVWGNYLLVGANVWLLVILHGKVMRGRFENSYRVNELVQKQK